MIAAALRYVDRTKGKNCDIFLNPKFIHSLCLSGWRKPGADRRPPLSGPITNGIGPRRRKKAKGLGITGVMGRSRRTTSYSPVNMRLRNCRQANHAKATAKR